MKPTTGSQSGLWERVCVVNRVIEKYVVATEMARRRRQSGRDSGSDDLADTAAHDEETEEDDDDDDDDDFDPGPTLGLRPQFVSTPDREKRLRRCRIRAFVWLPPLFFAQNTPVIPNRRCRLSSQPRDRRRTGASAFISGHRLLAVVNDLNELIILATSPVDIVSASDVPERVVDAEVLSVYRLRDDDCLNGRQFVFEDIVRSRTVLRNLVAQDGWGRSEVGTDGEDSQSTRLACTFGSKILVFDVTTVSAPEGDGSNNGRSIDIKLAANWSDPEAATDEHQRLVPAGPLAWAPADSKRNDADFLVGAVADTIVCLDLPLHLTEDAMRVHARKLTTDDGFGWDSVAGFTFIPPGYHPDKWVIQFGMDMSSQLTTPTLVLPELDPVSDLTGPGECRTGGAHSRSLKCQWQKNINLRRHKFCATNGLSAAGLGPSVVGALTRGSGGDTVTGTGTALVSNDAVLTKLFAVIGSPLLDIVATCSSDHPARMLEYRNAPDELVWIDVAPSLGPFDGYDEVENVFTVAHRAAVSFEYLAFSLTVSVGNWLDRRRKAGIAVTEPDHGRSALSDVILALWNAISSPSPVVQADRSGSDDRVSTVMRLHAAVFKSDKFRQRRFESLVYRVLSPLYPLRTVSFFSPWPSLSIGPDGVLSPVDIVIVRTLVDTVLAMVRDGTVAVPTQQDSLILSLYSTISKLLKSRAGVEGVDSPTAGLESSTSQEECHFCASPIGFEDVTMARCSRGHQFTRCALTFLSIQRPGISKRCGLCGLLYLSDFAIMPCRSGPASDRDSAEPGRRLSGDAIDVSSRVDDDDDDDETGALPLSELLCQAVDACLHCGGKFTG